MEEKAFRRSQELPFATHSEEEPLVQPQQPTTENSVASPRHSDPKDMFPEDLQGELVNPPTTSGRTSRELWQILKDAEDLVENPRNEKRQRKQPERHQALVAQVGEPSSFWEAAQGLMQWWKSTVPS